MKQIIATVRNVKSNLRGEYGRITSKELHEFADQEKKIVILDNKDNNLVELSNGDYQLIKGWYQSYDSEGFGSKLSNDLMMKIASTFADEVMKDAIKDSNIFNEYS